MSIPISLEAHLEKLKQLHNSEEYQQLCKELLSECDRLTATAQRLREEIPALAHHCNSHTARREYASGSTLQRGFYCPSPVYDIIVGNAHRGKILKRMTSRSNPSHEYGFDENGSLMWCQTLYNRKPSMIEYLVYEGNTVYGITIEPGRYPRIITEERYENGRIVQYLYGLLLPFGDSFSCREINGEFFAYDNDGLLSCETRSIHVPSEPSEVPEALRDLVTVLPRTPLCSRRKFRFDRKDGCLISYTVGDHQYQVLAKRKA